MLAIAAAAWTAMQLGHLSASAQSDTELRRENERLRERIKDLEDRVKRLEEAVRGGPSAAPATGATDGEKPTEKPAEKPDAPPPPAPQPPAAPAIADPSRIPASASSASEVLAYERLRYAAEFGAMPIDPAAAGSKQAERFLNRLDAWSVSEARAWRKATIEWTVRVQRAVRGRDGTWSITGFEAESPGQSAARTADGEPPIPIQFSIKARHGDRLKSHLEASGTVVITGTLLLNLRMDPDRPAAGPFKQNARPFVGPFCDAVFGVNIQSIELPPVEAPPP